MITLIAMFMMATILTWAIHVLAGRLAGVGVTVLCSATMAYFVMPPVFSFRVSQTHDLIALAIYGATGLLLVKTAPTRKYADPLPLEPSGYPYVSSRCQGTDLADALSDVMSSALGARLQALGLALPEGTLTLPCAHGEAVRILVDVLMAALQVPNVRRIAIHASQQPGVRQLIVAAHYVWPPPLNRVIIVGRRDEDCEAATFDGWPPNSHASWFDNGYDRIFQISVFLQR